ncbi:hypothetical protein RJ639_039105 [Escallonia herrerae]|uniref:Uncharacterized protein n=1 Tax=Escallonia herrerae TaxID=1293975 RepID=A0AA88WNY1_9ASTE|nr:hypothetical protein RJ639_039105 [Escallonia herrerae]
MAGCTRFEVTSASSEPVFANGQRGSHSGPHLDRSGSFREGVESRMLGSGVGTCRGSGALAGDLPTLSHSLMLEPIVLGDQEYTRSGELRMVMGCSVGSTLEDNSFGAAHLKPSPPMAMEELKRLRSSVADTCTKARCRVKKLDDHLSKLNKYCEAVTSKKPQRNEALGNERPSGLNLKMGTQIHRNPQEKLEDRPKTSLLNKRVRTAVAEARSECRTNGPPRQPLVIAKERDLPKDNDADPDLGEEKVGRLPGGGESWERKMKRRRSAGTVVTRAVDGDGESKRAMHHKLSNGPILQSFDGQNFRGIGRIGLSGKEHRGIACIGLSQRGEREPSKPKDL